jgi:hypothetical protein
MDQDEEVFFQHIMKHVDKLDKLEADKEARREKLKEDTVATLEEQVRTVPPPIACTAWVNTYLHHSWRVGRAPLVP